LQTITSLRSQLLNELVRTGLVHAGDLGYGAKKELKADAVVNRHAGNEALTTAVLTTGVPGNLASRRRQSHFGVMRTRLEATAGLHPASVSFHRSPPRGRYGQAQLPDWFMYKEMVLSSQVFLRDCSAVTPEQLALFGGSKMTDLTRFKPTDAEIRSGGRASRGGTTTELDDDVATDLSDRSEPPPLLGADGLPVIPIDVLPPAVVDDDAWKPGHGLIDDWILTSSSCPDTSELLTDVRGELDAALAHKVMAPRRALSQEYAEIVDAIAATLHIVDARNDAALQKLARSEGASSYGSSSSSSYGGGPAGRAGFGDASRRGFGVAPRKAGRLKKDANGNFVRVAD
jgi:ATP-dependent RNA helicase DHX36